MKLDFSGKILTGIGTAPLILIVMLSGTNHPTIPTFIFLLLSFVVVTLVYQKYVGDAPQALQRKRFLLFLILPALIIGLLSV
ncbi:hypothetical protein [Psychrosphaera haliotis]|uniref:Uncharacterized protein n=1 Tax=Psychrosphaera haliotis TaxID=555083 RepID=A0A6N8FB96_9GAMM|nr:hypothetical protein [Psychrosphaera haliotis]MUH72022.1 hypothetical protein [Psychrosphaera haliotis]